MVLGRGINKTIAYIKMYFHRMKKVIDVKLQMYRSKYGSEAH